VSGVEFLDDTGAELPGEEELTGGGGLPRWLGWLGGAALVAVVLTLLVSAGSSSRPDATATATATTTQFQFDEHRFDQPQVSYHDLSACPAGVLCSRLDHVPDSLVAAVRERVPRVRLGRVLNVEFVRRGDFGLAVWYRHLHFRTRQLQVELVVQQPTDDAADNEKTYVLGGAQVRLIERVLLGRTVIVRVEGTGALPSLMQLRALAADLRLVAL
jgi:hypothetical protein